MSQATTLNLYIENYDGEPTDVVFSLALDLSDSNDVPFPNLDGATVSFNAKTFMGADERVIEISTPDNIELNPLTGELKITLFVSDMTKIRKDIAEQTFIYDIDFVDSIGRFYRLLKGELVVGGDA
ncbi:MAG: hypothetical protein ACK4KU_14660 [Acinetobacter sp.]|uniref:hypothetical protein n=1 Tax=Acinetobacter sp. TaxID=472 RepID=UPI003919EC48